MSEPQRRGAAPQREQRLAAGRLLDEADSERKVAVRRHDDLAAEDFLDVDRRAVVQEIGVGDQDHRVVPLRFP
ncbi:MAG: hypothetical protein M5U08_25685 [Burkholderiales bacterium]|nr:hypothetical protein [Burkholderiales bacterium]